MNHFLTLVAISSGITTIITACVMLLRPIRERVLGIKDVRNGQRCLLRADMLRTYYKHCDANSIRQYEKENFIQEYNAYKALGGNSFIDDIYNEIRTWEIVQ